MGVFQNPLREAEAVAQQVECLPGMQEALDLIHSTASIKCGDACL